MNIFVTDSSPIQSAINLDDKRVIKMILESAQMLSTTMNLVGLSGPYRTTHSNHPCTIWVRYNQSNYKWLIDHFKALCSEYTRRYNKTHKCEQYTNLFESVIPYLPKGELSPFINCTDYKDLEVIIAYNHYMKKKWKEDKRTPSWK